MWHLSPEDLARLADEAPDSAEAAHLAACGLCAAEAEAMREQVSALRDLPHIMPTPTPWGTMRQRLRAEGLLAGARSGAGRAWMQAAAALTLFVAGGAFGFAAREGIADEPAGAIAATDATDRASRTDPPIAAAAGGDATPVAAASDPLRAAIDSLEARRAEGADPDAARPGVAEDYSPPARFAVAGAPADDAVLLLRPEQVDSPDEAARLVRQTEDLYLAAMTRFAELAGPQDGDVALRVATLDGIVLTTGAALREAPGDPVINGYHLAARAQRDAMLTSLSETTNTTEDPWF